MKRTGFEIFLGVMLIAAGLLFLLQTFNVIPVASWSLIWAVIFGIGGLVSVWRFLTDPHEQWWAIIPGLVLLALAVLTGADGFNFDMGAYNWPGVLFLGAIGISFLVVYFVRREHWWAIIPGGTLLTLALVVLVSDWFEGEIAGATFLFGMAITFGLLYFVPNPKGRMTWALIPAGVLAVLGVMVSLALGDAVNYVWALALIAAGIYLLYRQMSGGAAARRH